MKLPDGWKWTTLKDLGTFEAGGTPPKSNSDFWNGDIPFLTGADITSLFVSRNNARTFLSKEGLNSGKTAICEPGNILIVTRTRVGRSGIATEIMGVSQDITLFKCGSNINANFLCRYLHNISDYLIENSRGATIQGLTREVVNQLIVPLPPLEEQKRIVAILKEQMTAVEAARSASQARLDAIKYLPAAYLRQVFPGPGQPLPDGWNILSLGECGEVISGIALGRKMKSESVTKVSYLRVANVKDGHLDMTNVYTTHATNQEIQTLTLKYGDLLLTEGGDPDKLGRGTIWEDQLPICIHQNHIFRVRFPKEYFDPSFISAQIGSSYGKSYFLKHAKQTTGIATINQQVLKAFPLLVPDLKEQQRIVKILNEKLAGVESCRMAAEAELETINRLPSTLLNQAFRGEL